MKLTLLSITLFTICFLQAQSQLPLRYIKADVGPATLYYNGGMPGISFSTTYSHYFSNKLSFTGGLGGSINDAVINVFYKDPANGQTVDGSLRQSTGGVHLLADIGYSVVRTSRHEMQARLGAVGRFQSSSQIKYYSILYITPSGYPEYRINHNSKQRTVSFGGNVTFAYNYNIAKNITLGIEAGLQQHTNGNQLSRLGFSIGKRF